MPRRCNEVVQLALVPKKKLKIAEEPTLSLDVSFCDDEALPAGIVFSDVQQKKWRIGKPIGRGSFGKIYLASDDVEREVTKANARYVVKIEPHTNGPLFVEVHCLIRTASVDKVKAWRQRNKQKLLGMPVYIASGSFTDENTGGKYRFLVLPRYDIDLQKIIARTKVLDLKNVLVLAIQILDVLECLHNQGYTHSDIKSSNLMLGFDGNKWNKMPAPKSAPSFQKETKELAVLSGKQRRPKSGRARVSNYYEDEDFIVKDCKIGNGEEQDIESDRRLANVRKKLRKILSDKDNRTLHRHHAFNLRQLSNYVNYEDINSSVCSDQSYQKLLDDFGNKPFIRTSEEFYEEVKKKNGNISNDGLDEIFTEALLSQSNGQIYLLDYGLASKFLDSEGYHKDFGMDARKAHDGTLEYSSRDSHIGAHSRRSDLETLGYNLLDWLTGSLPWKTTNVLCEPDIVHALKKNFMSDIKSFLKTCFKTEFYPQFIEKYLVYVTSLDFKDKPDYDYCRSLFKSELLKSGYKNVCLNFAEPSMSPVNRKLAYTKRFGKKNTPTDFLSRNGVKKPFERENFRSLENDLKLELLKQTLNSSSDGMRKPCTSRNFFVSDADLVARLKKSLLSHDMFGKKLSPKNLRSNQKNVKKRRGVRKHRNSIGKFGNFMGSARQFTWAEILAGNPEDIIRKERNTVANDEDDEVTCKYRIRKLSNASTESTDSNLQSPLMQKDYLQNSNPTYAMKEVMANFKKKVSCKAGKEIEDTETYPQGYTPAMIKVYKMKEKREAREKAEAKQNAIANEAIVLLPRCTRSSKTNSKKSAIKSKVPIESAVDNVVKHIRKTRHTTTSEVKEKEEVKTPEVRRSGRQKKDKSESPDSKAEVRKSTRHKASSVEKMEVDLDMPKNNVRNKNTKVIANKKVQIETRKSPTRVSARKSPSRDKPSVPINRRRLRSSRRCHK